MKPTFIEKLFSTYGFQMLHKPDFSVLPYDLGTFMSNTW